MKKIVAFVVLMVMILNGAGFYAYYSISLQRIKRQQRALLRSVPKDQLEKLTLTRSEFNGAKVEEHEIKVNGKMFDIAVIEEVGEKLIVYCKHDKKEDNLLASVNRHFSKPINPDDIPSVVFQYLGMKFFIKDSEILITNSGQHIIHNCHHLDTCSDVVVKIVSPPPRG